MNRGLVICLTPCLLVQSCFCAGTAAAAGPDEHRAQQIQTLLTDHCAACHGGVRKNGGFSVLSRSLLLTPGDSDEPPVVPGDAERSALYRRIAAADRDARMPPQGHDPLTPKQIQLVREWIDAGADWPSHWAWRPIPRAPDPMTSATIDTLIAERLNDAGFAPSPPADRLTLLRRLSLDLTGLLPTEEEVASFSREESSAAVARLTDRLLSSPHFGERWGRHWLDEARYADSEGYEKDSPKQDAYLFRDWVIDAINEDMPFDEFTIRQIAGDLLPDATASDRIATKFHLQTQFNLEGGVDAEEDRTKRVIDQLSTVGTVWLGMSIGCSQCHDHPYDPLTQRDFYGVYAFFDNTDIAAMLPQQQSAAAADQTAEREKRWHKLSALLQKQRSNKNLSNSVQAQLTQLRKFDNEHGFVRYLAERRSDRRQTYLFHRGDFLQPDFEAGALTPQTPAILPALKSRNAQPDRLDLANWLVSDTNPLVARVTVNKIWMHLFGQPLADQPQDFGSRGGTPSHPKLLDRLADWWMHEGQWSRKALIRLIVQSRTYQQSSMFRDDMHALDPGNHLLARQNRVRVEAEIIRDIALQASGLLSRQVGGPGVFPPLPAIIAQQTYANSFRYRPSTGADRYRRGMYTFFRRTAIDPNLLTFDCPDSSITRPQRDRSNNPLQALALLHNEVFHEAAQHFSRRILSGTETTDTARIARAFILSLGRPPTEGETAVIHSLLSQSRDWYHNHPEQAELLVSMHRHEDTATTEQAAWTATLRVILNLDEFVTRG